MSALEAISVEPLNPVIGAEISGVDLSSPFVNNQPSFFSFVWSGAEPPGLYTMFLAAVVPGAFADGTLDEGDIVALGSVTFTFAP